MIDPNEKGVITRTQAVCRGSPKPFNISEQNFCSLTANTVESLAKLEKYQIKTGVIERLRLKKPFNKMTDTQVNEVVNEFKKFIAILVINHGNGNRIEMVSELVDEVWHTFILFTKEYRKFCDTMIGEYIHHEPNVTSAIGVDPLFPYKKNQGAEFFYKEYERYFGALPTIWNYKLPLETKSKNLKNPIRFGVLAGVITLVIFTLIAAYSVHYVGFAVLAAIYGFAAFVFTGTVYNRCKTRDSQYYLGTCFASIFISLLIMASIVVIICQEAFELGRAIVLISASSLSSIILGFLVRTWRRNLNLKKTLPITYRNNSGVRHSGFFGGGCGSIPSCSSGGGGGGCGGGGCGGGGC